MMAAPFMLCVLWCTVSPVEGARTVPPGEGRFHVAGGWGTLLPTLTVGGTVGVAADLDLDFRWETHAAIAHDISLTSRYGFAENWALSLSVNNVFFVIEEAGGIHASDAPVGNGVFVQPGIHRSFFFEDGVHVGLGAGLGFGLARLSRNEDDTVSREVEPNLNHLTLRVSVEWDGENASTFMRFSAVIPIQAEARLLGFFPSVSFGRNFEL